MIIKKNGPLKGNLSVPGDKSISHRAVMLGALAKGKTEIDNFLMGEDCLSTISCFRKMGIHIEQDIRNRKVIVFGEGLDGLKALTEILDVGNSGTTIRLLSGILCGQNFSSVITGDTSIQKRPMGRILTPLQQMEADIESVNNNNCAPLRINGPKNQRLKGIHYKSPIASAQVKSCVLLAGLYADGETHVTEPAVSRNHTEIMLSYFGGDVKVTGSTVCVKPRPKLSGKKINVPGDISSAAFLMAAALIVPNSEILIENVGINPTRDGILKVCSMMGADIKLLNIKKDGGEPAADILVRHSSLRGTEIGGDLIPTLIDEIPIIAILACFADGKTVIKDAQELRVKESDRIEAMVKNLSAMGADVEATEDGMIINGGKPLRGAVIDPKFDHRIAMSFAVAGLMADGETEILNPECVNISFPGFFEKVSGTVNKM
ncbi:3-phosphoshikimate 1-carboxyvinyltransferase [Herbinix hemicellulosilytica]|uniref:3-phosphoshikimate 1-carboxyvinyltransferase n=1 Tax=Herbinix hemicellulosilytica TaxID=1564487 RepID=A0A0H5SWV4_HERHM|nr:3-phosphoshikimate 1-carboxyvinyltransferase [Herbinix hemicellulosilytica]RBP59450.1 3-phosphoshikimate 1-carboxyvinyltransferase [Herbinix hemicellulosilytica]CRZ34828.1 3-phosphoshikimate 1-carboxyvinyltransferase [Herbinix hemicellulosilytica]